MSRTRIGALVSVQTIKRNLRAKELAEARKRVSEAEAKEQQTQEDIRQANQNKISDENRELDAQELGLYENYIAAKKETLIQEQHQTSRHRIIEERKRQKLVHTLKKLKSYEQYEVHVKAQNADEQRTREARELDEIAIQAFYAKKRT